MSNFTRQVRGTTGPIKTRVKLRCSLLDKHRCRSTTFFNSFFLISESVDGDIEGLYLQNVQESEWKTDTIVRDTRARKVSSDIKQAWHEMK